MFNRYWRTYPWGLQLALFILTVFTLLSFSTYLVLTLLPRLSGVPFNDLVHLTTQSPAHATRVSLLAQAISHVGTFAVPALLFASLTHPRVREYLGLRPPGRPAQWLLVTGVMLGLIPVSLWGESWVMHHIHLGKWADAAQLENDGTIGAFLRLRTSGDFALLLSVLALLPAVGEELVFRGIFLRLVHRRATQLQPVATVEGNIVPRDVQRSMVFPVIVSALFFAFWHSNPYGFTFIFLAGCVLALIYSLTGSLLCSIWAHFLYNGVQVAMAYFSAQQPAAAAGNIGGGDSIPALYPIAGAVLFAASFYALVRTQTPLPADWSTDFKTGEA